MNAQAPHIAEAGRIEELATPEVQEEIRENHVQACRELHERFVDMAKRRGAIDAAEVDAIIEAIEMRVWMEYGMTSLISYLEHVMGYPPRLAIERERVARELRELPDTYESLKHGLPWSKVRELTRVVTPETEGAWLDATQGKNLREVEALVSGRGKGDLPTDPTKPETTKRAVCIEMTPEQYAMFRKCKAELSKECGERLEDGEALAVMARRVLEPAPSSKPAAQVTYTICSNCRATTTHGGGVIADVSPASRDCALCDADDLGDLDASNPERVASEIPPRIRRQVLARDHETCIVPGCRVSQGIDIHHLKHREHGGGHEMSNLGTLCCVHHKMVHAGRLLITGTADHLSFRRILPHDDAVEDLGTYDLTTEPDSYPRGYESDSVSAPPSAN
ncbi:MAG: HNH endonuclease [Deltaproteobacteria bacterium]|nr:HNH endonuclease [Deltaproteobacteria bacterium]